MEQKVCEHMELNNIRIEATANTTDFKVKEAVLIFETISVVIHRRLGLFSARAAPSSKMFK